MISLKRFIEIGSDGRSTGRVRYCAVGKIPEAVSGGVWQLDPSFKIEGDAFHAPDMLKHYQTALTVGYTIVDQ